MVGVLENPYLSCAFGSIKLCRRPKNLQEHGLHQVFSFAGVAQNAQRNVQNQTMVAVEKHGKSVVVPCRKMEHHGFV
jgi:hypothetical protein